MRRSGYAALVKRLARNGDRRWPRAWASCVVAWWVVAGCADSAGGPSRDVDAGVARGGAESVTENPDPNPNPNPNPDSESEPDPDPESEPDSDPERDPDPEREPDSDAERDGAAAEYDAAVPRSVSS